MPGTGATTSLKPSRNSTWTRLFQSSESAAGGLESISELLAALPPKSDLAFVVVQHLDPQHESLLSDLLSKRTALPVAQIHDGLAVETGHVYVIPPNTTLRLTENRFHLTARELGLPHPIDILVASLAEARAGAAIGVVLSGADSDGSLGVQSIKLHGGITFAQEPQSARFPSMPRSAIETGDVDFVLSPRGIARELVRLGSHPYLRRTQEPQIEASEEVPAAREDDHLRRVFRLLRTAHGAGSHFETEAQSDSVHRVLIVDDNVDSAESLALLVASWGHEVAVARDGPSALEVAARFQPERALVDIGLPGMDGYELAHRLREQNGHEDFQLIAMTGYGRDEDCARAHTAGFDVHLVKPADLNKLQELLANSGGRDAGE